MRTGRLKHRLIVEKPSITRDDAGDEVVGWSLVATVWAAIEPARGRESVNAGQVLAQLDTQIIIRWSPPLDDITAKWRLRHAELNDPVIYNIVSVAHVNLGRRQIDIIANSGPSGG